MFVCARPVRCSVHSIQRRFVRVDPRPGIAATQTGNRRCRAHSVEPARAVSPSPAERKAVGRVASVASAARAASSEQWARSEHQQQEEHQQQGVAQEELAQEEQEQKEPGAGGGRWRRSKDLESKEQDVCDESLGGTRLHLDVAPPELAGVVRRLPSEPRP